MNNKTITPSFQQPGDRIASGQLPSALAELSEAALSGTLTSDVLPLGFCNGFMVGPFLCSYDGGDE